MSDRAQTRKPAADLQLGRRHDPAEARVEARLEQPGLRELHGDALSGLAQQPERTSLEPPGSLDAMLGEPGTPLPGALRRRMEGAFGESFSDVRLHTGAAAAGAARAMNSAAFAAGPHVGLAPGAWRPDTAAGRGLIAHELAHVSETRAGRDDPAVVRGVGVAESIGNFFQNLVGYEGFDDAELTEFVDELSRGRGEFTQVSDNMARAIVKRGLHDRSKHDGNVQNTTLAKAADLDVRYLLIKHLLSGPTLGGDEEAILTILRDADPLEREQLVAKVTMPVLRENFSGSNLDELRTLFYGGTLQSGDEVRGTTQTADTPQPVRWELDYEIEGDGRLASNPAGLAVRNFEIEPDRQSERTVAEHQFLMSSGETLGAGPVSHPKNVGGLGRMEIWVVPEDASERALYADKASAVARPYPGSAEASGDPEAVAGVRYGNIPAAEDQTVKAMLHVDLGAEEIGEATVGRTVSVTGTETARVGETRAQTARSGITDTAETESNWGSTIRRLDRLSAAVGLSAQSARRFELRRDWEIGVSRIEQQMLQTEAELSGETEEVDETEGEVDINAEISAEAALALKTELGIDLGVDLDLSELAGGLLDEVLSRIPDKRVQALAAIFRVVQGASGGVTMNVSPEGQVSFGGSLGGGVKARRLWRLAKRRGYRFGVTSGETTTDERNVRAGGGATVGGEDTVSRQEELARAREQERQQSRGGATRRGQSVSTELEIMNQRIEELERQLSVAVGEQTSTTTPLRVPTVESAYLTFHVVKDTLGQDRPRSLPDPSQRQAEEKGEG